MREWKFSDLVCDHKTGKLRESALWSNIGKAAMTVAFLYVVFTDKSTETLWLAFGALVIGHASVERLLGQRQQKLDKEPT